MPIATTPNTLSVAQAIAAYGQALTYPGGGTVYSGVSIGEMKDITEKIVVSGSACLEVYANSDDSQHLAFGGKVRDDQSWYLLSLVNMDDAAAAEALIYQVRDALIQPFQAHATLGNAGNVFHSQIKSGSGRFLRVFRNGQWLRAHLIEVQTISEWFVPTPPGVIA
jgi:hypothetical protein